MPSSVAARGTASSNGRSLNTLLSNLIHLHSALSLSLRTASRTKLGRFGAVGQGYCDRARPLVFALAAPLHSEARFCNGVRQISETPSQDPRWASDPPGVARKMSRQRVGRPAIRAASTAGTSLCASLPPTRQGSGIARSTLIASGWDGDSSGGFKASRSDTPGWCRPDTPLFHPETEAVSNRDGGSRDRDGVGNAVQADG